MTETVAIALKSLLCVSTVIFLAWELAELPNGQLNAMFIFGCSGAFAALGGIAAALRLAVKSSQWSVGNIVSHAVNMGCFGMFLSMIAVWYFEKMTEATGYAIIGFCGLCGLVGVPLIDPLAGMIQATLQRLFQSTGSPKNDN